MLLLNQNTKANKRANRIISRLRTPRENDLGYPLEWYIENGVKNLNPHSILGAVLHIPNDVHNVLLSAIERTGARTEWDSVHEGIQRRTERIRSDQPKRLAKHKKAKDYIPHLVDLGVKPKDITTVMTMIQNSRSRLRRSNERERLSWSSKVEAFKENWTSMRPDRVQDEFLPKGTAIGVEIEWLARACESSDYEGGYDRNCIDFKKPNPAIHGVQWFYDTSISTSEDYHYETGQEAKVMLRYGKWNRLTSVCKHIRSQGGEINKSCGLHVHLDVRNISKAATITRCRRLETALPWLLKIIPPSRAEGNTYCSPTFSQYDKYHAITMHSFRRQRKSIEVRCHSATLNPKKIIRWIELLMFLKESYKHYPTFESFINSMAPYDLKEYVIKRKTKFTPRIETPEEEQDSDSEQLTEAVVPSHLPPLPAPTRLPDRS